jgi:hypothetical protein
MRSLAIKVKAPARLAPPEPQAITLDVVCRADGLLTITADPTTMARLGGRGNFGSAAPVQTVLLERVADAWYSAGCPEAPR